MTSDYFMLFRPLRGRASSTCTRTHEQRVQAPEEYTDCTHMRYMYPLSPLSTSLLSEFQ